VGTKLDTSTRHRITVHDTSQIPEEQLTVIDGLFAIADAIENLADAVRTPQTDTRLDPPIPWPNIPFGQCMEILP
jgi:hypothetical protein